MKPDAPKIYSENRKARHEYLTLEKFQGGLALEGWEVKAIREGGAKLDGAYLTISRGELWLYGAHIRPYSKASRVNPFDTERSRKVLITKKELLNLAGKTAVKGLTIVPLAVYFNKVGRAKTDLALVKGKRQYDKRQDIKEKETRRQIERRMKDRGAK